MLREFRPIASSAIEPRAVRSNKNTVVWCGTSDYDSRVKVITGITRVVLSWYSAKPGYNAAILSYSSDRSGSEVTVAWTGNCSVPTSTLTSGLATTL